MVQAPEDVLGVIAADAEVQGAIGLVVNRPGFRRR